MPGGQRGCRGPSRSSPSHADLPTRRHPASRGRRRAAPSAPAGVPDTTTATSLQSRVSGDAWHLVSRSRDSGSRLMSVACPASIRAGRPRTRRHARREARRACGGPVASIGSTRSAVDARAASGRRSLAESSRKSVNQAGTTATSRRPTPRRRSSCRVEALGALDVGDGSDHNLEPRRESHGPGRLRRGVIAQLCTAHEGPPQAAFAGSKSGCGHASRPSYALVTALGCPASGPGAR
jgi:hypothetical protein